MNTQIRVLRISLTRDSSTALFNLYEYCTNSQICAESQTGMWREARKQTCFYQYVPCCVQNSEMPLTLSEVSFPLLWHGDQICPCFCFSSGHSLKAGPAWAPMASPAQCLAQSRCSLSIHKATTRLTAVPTKTAVPCAFDKAGWLCELGWCFSWSRRPTSSNGQLVNCWGLTFTIYKRE